VTSVGLKLSAAVNLANWLAIAFLTVRTPLLVPHPMHGCTWPQMDVKLNGTPVPPGFCMIIHINSYSNGHQPAPEEAWDASDMQLEPAPMATLCTGIMYLH
jgi:hypothetical protein